MGGEIFKDSLRKLEAKSIQKSQKNISLETRQNSLSNDINLLKNESALAVENLSQRPRKREINKSIYISHAYARKIIADKSILANITRKTSDKIKETINKLQKSNIWSKESHKRANTVSFEAKMKISNTKQNVSALKTYQAIQYINLNRNIDINLTNFNFYVIAKTISGKDFYITLLIYFNNYRLMIDIQLSFTIFDPGISAHTIKFKLFLHIYVLYINSKNKFNLKAMDIIYDKKITMLLDEDAYTEFKETCENLNNYVYNEETNITRLRWLAFLMLFTHIFGNKIYFNEKFGRLKVSFDDKDVIIPIPNEVCIFSAYIDVKQIRNMPNWDFCADDNIISIIRNLN